MYFLFKILSSFLLRRDEKLFSRIVKVIPLNFGIFISPELDLSTARHNFDMLFH